MEPPQTQPNPNAPTSSGDSDARKKTKHQTMLEENVLKLNANKQLNTVQEAINQKLSGPNVFVHGKWLKFAQQSLFCLSVKNPIRQGVIWFHEWKYFDSFITITILFNSVLLMFQDYSFRLDPSQEDTSSSALPVTEYIFAVIFIGQFLLKTIGMGFITEEGCYLRDGWNILDFIVVISSVVSFFPGTINISALRTFRILRPLRSINAVEGMRIMVSSLIDALPDLGNVVIFLFFIIALFGILGLQLFLDVFEYRCRTTQFPVNGVWTADPLISHLCEPGRDNCPAGRWCGSPADYNIVQNDEEIQIQYLNYGYTTFDNFPKAIFTIFQSLTTEGWSSIVYILIDAYEPVIVFIYFLLLILIGSFFVVNLILAVINESFVTNQIKNQRTHLKQRLGFVKQNGQLFDTEEMQQALKDSGRDQNGNRMRGGLIGDNTDQQDQGNNNQPQAAQPENGLFARYKNQTKIGSMISSDRDNIESAKIIISPQQIGDTIKSPKDPANSSSNTQRELVKTDLQKPALNLSKKKTIAIGPSSNNNVTGSNQLQVTIAEEKLPLNTNQIEEVLLEDGSKPAVQPLSLGLQKTNVASKPPKQLFGSKQADDKKEQQQVDLENSQKEDLEEGQKENSEEIHKLKPVNEEKPKDEEKPKAVLPKQKLFGSNQVSKEDITDAANKPEEASKQLEQKQQEVPSGGTAANGAPETTEKPSETAPAPALPQKQFLLPKEQQLLEKQQKQEEEEKKRIEQENQKLQEERKAKEEEERKNSQAGLPTIQSPEPLQSSGRGNYTDRSSKSNQSKYIPGIEIGSEHNNKNVVINQASSDKLKQSHSTLKDDGQKMQKLGTKGYDTDDSSDNTSDSDDDDDDDDDEENKKQSEEEKLQRLRKKSKRMSKYITSINAMSCIRRGIRKFIDSKTFMAITTFCIIGNTIILSLDRYPEPPEAIYTDYINLGFTLIFCLEMILKIYGMGIRDYLRDQFNIFDGSIVIMSMVELIFDTFGSGLVSGGGFGAIQAFRSLRLFRIFQLARSWVNLRNLLIAIGKTLGEINNFLVLVLLFMVIASLLGMEFFAYKIRFNDDGSVADDPRNGTSPRENCDNFLNGVITIFILLTNENWNSITYTFMRGFNSWIPIVFFTSVVIFGNFILLKLFLAILIYNFGQASEENQQQMLEQKELEAQASAMVVPEDASSRMQSARTDTIKPGLRSIMSRAPSIVNPQSQGISRAVSIHESGAAGPAPEGQQVVEKGSPLEVKNDAIPWEIQSPDPNLDLENKKRSNSNIIKRGLSRGQTFKSGEIEEQDDENNKKLKTFGDQQQIRRKGFGGQADKSIVIEGYSLFLFGPRNFIRKAVVALVNNNQFEAFIISLILISSIMLVLDDPLMDPESPMQVILTWLDMIMSCLFLLETVIKILAAGLIFNGQNSFLRSMSNVLDTFIVGFSMIDVIQFGQQSNSSLSKLKILRILRVLRPLRLVSRNEGLKLAINALILSIPSMLNLLVVCLIFFLLFGIFGVNFFKGSYFMCKLNDLNIIYDKLIDNQFDCMDYGGDWVNFDLNFDNILNAMVNLYVLSTTEGWVDLMWYGVDTRGIDLNPKLESRMYWSLFFIFFIIVGAFFVMNLFAGIVVDSFNTEGDQLRGISTLTFEQQAWVEVKLRMLDSEPEQQMEIPQNSSYIRRKIWDFVSMKMFDHFIFFCIILNTFMFMLVWHRQDTQYTDLIKLINYVFLGIFSAEAALKIYCIREQYFKDSWNQFDVGVVALTLIGVGLEQLGLLTNIGTATSILRSFRIARVLRLIKQAKSLRMMFITFIRTIPALANIGGLLFLILFLYSVLGMNLYYLVKRSPDDGVTDKTNFTGFWNSFFALFKASTGQSWNRVLGDITRSQQPDFACIELNSYDDYILHGFMGCGSVTGYFYLITFQLLFTMIMLNLFVAVILEGFQKTLQEEHSNMKPSQLENYQEVWKQFDPVAQGYMPAFDIFQFLGKIEDPLGWSQQNMSMQSKRRFLSSLEIPIYHLQSNQNEENSHIPYFFYYDVLEAIVQNNFKETLGHVNLQPESFNLTYDKIKQQHKKRLNNVQNLMQIEYSNDFEKKQDAEDDEQQYFSSVHLMVAFFIRDIFVSFKKQKTPQPALEGSNNKNIANNDRNSNSNNNLFENGNNNSLPSQPEKEGPSNLIGKAPRRQLPSQASTPDENLVNSIVKNQEDNLLTQNNKNQMEPEIKKSREINVEDLNPLAKPQQQAVQLLENGGAINTADASQTGSNANSSKKRVQQLILN